MASDWGERYWIRSKSMWDGPDSGRGRWHLLTCMILARKEEEKKGNREKKERKKKEKLGQWRKAWEIHIYWYLLFTGSNITSNQGSVFIHFMVPPQRNCIPSASSSALLFLPPCKYEPACITDPISGDSGGVSEPERHGWVSQKRLTGERGGGERHDGKNRWAPVFLRAASLSERPSVKPHEHIHVSS